MNGQSGLPLTMFNEYRGTFRDVSPDGSLLCLFASRKVEYDLQDWTYDGGHNPDSADSLRVLDIASGNTVFATRLRSLVLRARFFQQGTRLYAETSLLRRLGDGSLLTQRADINLETHSLSENLSTESVSCFPLRWPSLLGVVSKPPRGNAALQIVTLPDFVEQKVVPFAPIPDPPKYGPPVVTGAGAVVYGNDTNVSLSADRTTIAYGAGHSLVCRNSADLGVRWTRPIGSEYVGAWLADVTPNGSHVAAAVIDHGDVTRQNKYYVGIYDGRAGAVVSELPLNGFRGISLSPDGTLVGVSSVRSTTGNRVEPTVTLYEVAKGRNLGSVHHPAVDPGGRDGQMLMSITSRFTPDGKYLITSTADRTRLWTLT